MHSVTFCCGFCQAKQNFYAHTKTFQLLADFSPDPMPGLQNSLNKW